MGKRLLRRPHPRHPRPRRRTHAALLGSRGANVERSGKFRARSGGPSEGGEGQLNGDALATAWAAGLFEGEGCISWVKVSGNQEACLPKAVLTLTSTDRDVVESFMAVVGCGAIGLRSKKPDHWKNQWTWSCGKWSDVSKLLLAFLPHLHARRRQKAMEVLTRGGDARKRVCECCGELFVAQVNKARFCSSRCQDREKKNRRRAAKQQ